MTPAHDSRAAAMAGPGDPSDGLVVRDPGKDILRRQNAGTLVQVGQKVLAVYAEGLNHPTSIRAPGGFMGTIAV